MRIFKNKWFTRFADKEDITDSELKKIMKVYRDEIAKMCHEIVEDGYRAGIINNAEMKEFETNCYVKKHETSNKPEVSEKTKVEYATA